MEILQVGRPIHGTMQMYKQEDHANIHLEAFYLYQWSSKQIWLPVMISLGKCIWLRENSLLVFQKTFMCSTVDTNYG